MTIKIFQKGFNYSQDGQGNRIVYHLQGCNMLCPWCSNPEGFVYSAPTCDEYSLDEITSEALSCMPMFFDGGGVTLTGGEATLQFDAVRDFLTNLKEHGINTALETNATHENLDALFPLIDELIIDLKHYDNAKHKAYTNMDNTVIISNIQKALNHRNQLLIRIPLVNGFNADVSDIPHFISLIKAFNLHEQKTKDAAPSCCVAIELLPYHEYGKYKWANCGMEYQYENGFVSTNVLNEFHKQFCENGINVVKT